MSQLDSHFSKQPSLLNYLVWLWLSVTAWLTYEYLILNGIIHKKLSILGFLHAHEIILPETKLSPEPGSSLSWFLGWLGFGLICLTNVYVISKKKLNNASKNKLSRLLDVHIFFGLLGPTLIVFHCNFKVRGLVSISFWSMMICFFSGIVGRYFYLQLLRSRGELKAILKRYELYFSSLTQKNSAKISARDLEHAKSQAYQFVGGSSALKEGHMSLIQVILVSIAGDLRLIFSSPLSTSGMNRRLASQLSDYALILRRLHASRYFRRLMGYWHSFHKPFAIFMYIVTVIHIGAALIFRVHTP